MNNILTDISKINFEKLVEKKDPTWTDIVKKNHTDAYNLIPESFFSVNMLYMHVQINDIPITAFVDTGAQITIMSHSMAKKLGVTDLIWKGYNSTMKGVGEQKSIGKIFCLDMVIGSSIIPCSFVILENSPDIIFGLDMMKAHGCIIDLKEKKMKIGDDEVHFLEKKEVTDSGELTFE
ncbi:MAG: hypothetical protein CMF62_00470 [Magnetococcales bacterium]|nr:hypothetical protein [Magnetococcales bacterium]|tara:strand:- start:6675 stop:7208 length:534 start_codon:yes stop_codon:yes gene_type:complete